MVGVITSWDVLAHPMTTIQCFGWLVFFRAAVPWHDVPFLSLVRDAGLFRAPPSNVPRILDRCIDLELRAKRIYNALAKALFDQGSVGPFFADLAEQEQQHADLLEVVRSAAMRSGWNASLFNPWEDYLPRLERQMDAAEAAVREIDSVDAALQMVIEIESSEVNKVFNAILAATEADFVKKLRPFRRAMEAHMAYIAERIPQLSPRMLAKVRELRASFPQLRA
jgi:rubrerythrin